MRLLRGLLLFKLGFWAGMYASAAILKRTFPSRGDEDSDELALVAILNGVELKSRAQAFRAARCSRGSAGSPSTCGTRS